MPEKKIKVYLITGEPSGDLLASRLMRALKKQTQQQVVFYGVGGESMQSEGLQTLFPISDLSVMGFWEVVPSIPKILKRIRQTLDDIEKVQPDIVVTVDTWSFSKQIHLGLKKRKMTLPHIHYVAPQVWAWKEKRAQQIKKWVDHLMMLLPFEAKYFAPHHVPFTYVGHPVIEGGADKGDAARFRQKYGLDKNAFILTVLPGSRHSEVKFLLPIFQEVVHQLSQKIPNLKVVIPTVATVQKKVIQQTRAWDVPVLVVMGEKDRYDAFAASSLGLAASGTVSLELSMAGVPHIIAYQVSKLSAFIARRLLKIKYVNLINILADQKIIPELLQEDCNSRQIMLELEKLMTQTAAEQKRQAAAVLTQLGAGEDKTPSEKAALVVRKIIKDNDH